MKCFICDGRDGDYGGTPIWKNCYFCDGTGKIKIFRIISAIKCKYNIYFNFIKRWIDDLLMKKKERG